MSLLLLTPTKAGVSSASTVALELVVVWRSIVDIIVRVRGFVVIEVVGIDKANEEKREKNKHRGLCMAFAVGRSG